MQARQARPNAPPRQAGPADSRTHLEVLQQHAHLCVHLLPHFLEHERPHLSLDQLGLMLLGQRVLPLVVSLPALHKLLHRELDVGCEGAGDHFWLRGLLRLLCSRPRGVPMVGKWAAQLRAPGSTPAAAAA